MIGTDRIGIVVCNYNKSEYVKNCVASLLEQTYISRDIYVVDNASTDDSVQMLRNVYGNRITILQNEENLGGSGGFDRGIEYCMQQGYAYIMLADNDTYFAKDVLERLYRYLIAHDDVGMCGANILQMKAPEVIQELGIMIDWQKYRLCPNYRGKNNLQDIPEVLECDALAACALLVRSAVVEKCGEMRKDYFIYWDDIDWCCRCKKAGYRLVALRDACVYHNWSAKLLNKYYPYTEYYGRRNKLRYFATYIDTAAIASFINDALRNVFNILYGHYRKGAYEEMKLTLYALSDFIHNTWGKTQDSRLMIDNAAEIPLEKLLKAKGKVYLIPNQEMGKDGGIATAMRVIRFCNPTIRIIRTEAADDLDEDESLYMELCPHVIRAKHNILPVIWIDEFLNCIATQEDYDYFQNYENAYKMFYRLYEPLMKEGIEKLRAAENEWMK